jgi:hypothetical protein
MKIKALAIVLLFSSITISAQNIPYNCYRGSLDVGCSIGFNEYQFERFEINNIHGFQIDPIFFLGFGYGIHYSPEYNPLFSLYTNYSREAKIDVPIYANLRLNIKNSFNSPYIDARIGKIITNDCGVYMCFSVGYRIPSDEKRAVNLSLGYTMAQLNFHTSHIFQSNYYYANHKTESITLRIGYEF